MKSFVCGSVLCLLLTSASVAAGAAEEFGSPSQVVITGAFGVAAEHVIEHDRGPGSRTQILIAPAGDLFVLRGLSVGGQLTYLRAWLDVGESTLSMDSFAIGPRLGYAVNLDERLSLWPALFANHAVVWQLGPGPTTSATTVSVGASVPLVVHLAPHFMLGFGPSVTHYVSSQGDYDARLTRFAANTFVGGWL